MLKTALLCFAALCLLNAPALAKEQKLKAKANGQVEFVMPSGNVGCIYTPEGGTDTYEPLDGGPELSCDRVEPSYVNILLGPNDAAEVWEDPGEQSCCGAGNVFAYDRELVLDGFICQSETTGLVCQTESGEHGFLLSKAHAVGY